MTEVRARYLAVGGVQLHVESCGAGEPVLLLHGGFCSLEPLRPQAEALAAEFAVHAYERPGHGRSPDTPGPFGYDAWTAQAVAVLDALDLGPVHVVGHSDGAIVGLLLAVRHPERVRSLVAISGNLDPSGFTWTTGLEQTYASTQGTPAPDPERDRYDRLSPDGPAHAEVVLAKLLRLWTTEPQITPAELAGISAPTLVLAGDQDTVHPEHSRLIADSIPGAQLRILPDATHDLVAEHPERLTGVLQEFLRPQGASAGNRPPNR